MGRDFWTGVRQEHHGLFHARAFDQSQIGQHYQRRAIDAGGAMNVNPMALPQQIVQHPHRRRQTTPLVIGIEIAQGTTLHRQAERAAMPDMTRIVDSVLFQALVMLHRQNRGDAGFQAQAVQITDIERATAQDQIVPHDVPIQLAVPDHLADFRQSRHSPESGRVTPNWAGIWA